MQRIPLLSAIALCSVWGALGAAHAVPQPDIHAWARATPPGATNAVAYLTVQSPINDRLIRITSPQAKTVSMHRMVMKDGMMTMSSMPDGLVLQAGKTVRLVPGGDHIMLEGLKMPLHQGKTLHLRLEFEHASPLDIDAPVESFAASHAPVTEMDGM